jgi:lysyl-tRNA synthetase class 1
MRLTIPPTIEEEIAKIDRGGAVPNERMVHQALASARNALSDPGEENNLGAWSEVLAFALMGDCRRSGPWGTYFGPIGSGTRADGTTWYSPDINDAVPEVIDHWEGRARTVTHPVLKARYADLVWDLSRVIAKKSPNPDIARIAVDAYLVSIRNNLRTDIHGKFDTAVRALDLAIMTTDAARIDAARNTLLELNRQVLATGDGLWWIAFDRLIEEKRAGLTDGERDELVAGLESVVKRCSVMSNPEAFDPHFTQSAAKRLIKYYNRVDRHGDARRLHTTIGESFEHFASLGDAMLAASVLQTASDAYHTAGLKEETRRVRVAMEQKIAQSHELLKPISVERTITREDMEQLLSEIVVPDPGSTLVRIASEFLQRKTSLQEQLNKLSEEAPLMATLTHSIMADHHVAAKVGSVDEDLSGRIIQHAAQNIALADVYLYSALERAKERHSLTPHHFVGWAARTGLFEDLSLLFEGVMAWYEEDWVKAIHVLVPQIELGLRGIVAALGKPITKPHATVPGVSVAIGMGDILHSKEIASALGEDLTLHFLTLYADPRGFNLRNDLAHGLLVPGRINRGQAMRLIHTLLILGIWDDLSKIRNGSSVG